MIRRTWKLIALALLLLVMAQGALAIGVVPATRTVDFEPGKTVSYDLEIVNNGAEDLEVMIYAKGKYADSVEISEQMLSMRAADPSKSVTVKLTMPLASDISPGKNEIDIVAVGSKKGAAEAGAMVRADLAIISKLVIELPYPEKYAEARVHVLDTETGDPVVIDIPVFNKGDKTLDEVYADVVIKSNAGEILDTFTTDKRALRPGQDTKFTVTAGVYDKGQYVAEAVVYYDQRQVRTKTSFTIGDVEVELKSLAVEDFTLGGIAKFDIVLYNAWTTDLKGVYAEMQIVGEDNEVYTDFKTVAVDIPTKKIKALEGYWNTEGVMPGIYTARVTLHYANRVAVKDFELEVQPNSIVARSLGTGRAVSVEEEAGVMSNMFLILVIIVMAVVIGVLVWKLRRKGSESGPQKLSGSNPPPKD